MSAERDQWTIPSRFNLAIAAALGAGFWIAVILLVLRLFGPSSCPSDSDAPGRPDAHYFSQELNCCFSVIYGAPTRT